MSGERKLKAVPKTARVVQQFTKDNILIREFRSLKAVTREQGTHFANVQKVCEGIRKTAGGYIWKYKNDITGGV